MKFDSGANKSNGGSVNVENKNYKKCDNVNDGASFNTTNDVSITTSAVNDNSDNPYAELEIYLENVKVSDSVLCSELLPMISTLTIKRLIIILLPALCVGCPLHSNLTPA